MLATQLDGERGDAYVAFESVMRVHARDGDWRRDWGRSGAVNETETFEGNEKNGGKRRGTDKRNVESKKQKGREEIKVRFES